MKIAIISPWAISKTSVGGTERFTIDLASQLRKLGHEPEVFVMSGKSRVIDGVNYTSLNILGQEKEASEYDLQTFADNSKGEAFYRIWANYLESAIDGSQFDLIQLNSLLFIDAWTEKDRILTVHTNPFEYCLDWGQQRFDYVVEKIRTSLPIRTQLVAPAEHYSKLFSEIFDQPVTTIPHAIDTSRLGRAIGSRAPGTNGAAKDGVTILLPSRLELIQKRPQIVFCGIALLPEHVRKRIKVIATGKDSQYQDNCLKLERIAKEGGFEAQFTKFKSMDEAYALADVVALPSKSESFGYSALESLTLNIPTILNSLPTFKEIGTGNANAHFFDQTAQAFSITLLSLLEGLKSCPNSVEWRSRYDIELWAQKYLNLVNEPGLWVKR